MYYISNYVIPMSRDKGIWKMSYDDTLKKSNNINVYVYIYINSNCNNIICCIIESVNYTCVYNM